MIKVFKNLSQLVTMKDAFDKGGRNLLPADLTIIEDGALVFNEAKILWTGKTSELPENYQSITAEEFNGVLVPEIVDCHTHLVFGGDRSSEYSMRLNGADYEEIASSGGGILNTMTSTNSLSEEELFNEAVERILRLNSYGVGTIEIKSGYGLNFEKEYEVSKVIHKLKIHFAPKIKIINTFMAAHAVPKSFKTSNLYIKECVIPLMEKLHSESLIDAVDIFHEKGYFDNLDVSELFTKAKQLGLSVKSHADEFQDNKGALLAAKFEALSTDHLLMTQDDGIEALAKSNTVATLLPGTGFFLGKPQANARRFLDKGCRVAIGSDYNPGSCHCDNVLLIASLAAPTYKMNLAELWSSITLNAASALGLENQGAIKEGLSPRFSLFDVKSIDQITYNWGRNYSNSLLF